MDFDSLANGAAAEAARDAARKQQQSGQEANLLSELQHKADELLRTVGKEAASFLAAHRAPTKTVGVRETRSLVFRRNRIVDDGQEWPVSARLYLDRAGNFNTRSQTRIFTGKYRPPTTPGDRREPIYRYAAGYATPFSGELFRLDRNNYASASISLTYGDAEELRMYVDGRLTFQRSAFESGIEVTERPFRTHLAETAGRLIAGS